MRKRLNRSYFDEESETQFVSSGCTLLDCVLGGGYPLGRIVNIVGDKGTNKTGLGIEVSANFAITYSEGDIWYAEAEAAFDKSYAKKIGLPDKVKFVQGIRTVEDLFNDLDEKTKEPREHPSLYILDSLDALSDAAELDREFDAGTFGTKAKKMGELFRRLIDQISKSKMLLIIVSQERDKINVTFGKKSTRSGGRALDFYASQILWLAEIKKIKRTVRGIERSIGILVRVKCEKNKVGLPFRECDFPVVFMYGIEDVEASLQFLSKVKMLDRFDSEITSKNIAINSKKMLEIPERIEKLKQVVKEVWNEIETGFMPTRSKY